MSYNYPYQYSFQPNTPYHISFDTFSIIHPYYYDPHFKIFTISDQYSHLPSLPIFSHAIFIDIHSPQHKQHFTATPI